MSLSAAEANKQTIDQQEPLIRVRNLFKSFTRLDRSDADGEKNVSPCITAITVLFL